MGACGRLALDAQGTVASRTTTNAYRLALLLSYGKFGADVAIIAPTGAVAVTPTRGVGAAPVVGGTGEQPGVLPVATLTPLGEATSGAGLLSATHIVRIVAIVSLVVIGAVVAVAVWRGGRRRDTRPAARSRR